MSMYLAFVANSNTNRLLVSNSGDGKNWQPSSQVGNESSKRAPAISFISSGPQGFTLGFVANDASNQLLVSQSADGKTWSPITPIWGAEAAVDELGDARLLKVDGDGHTSMFVEPSVCRDDGELAYLVSLQLPAKGTVCNVNRLPFGLSPGP